MAPHDRKALLSEYDNIHEALALGLHSIKAIREYQLRRIRELERILGLPSKPYNSDAFTPSRFKANRPRAM